MFAQDTRVFLPLVLRDLNLGLVWGLCRLYRGHLASVLREQYGMDTGDKLPRKQDIILLSSFPSFSMSAEGTANPSSSGPKGDRIGKETLC